MVLTAAQKKKCEAFGFDWQNLDLKKLLEVLGLLVSLFEAPKSPQGHEAMMRAAGCPDGSLDTACHCCEAGRLAIQSAMMSFACCDSCCKPAG